MPQHLIALALGFCLDLAFGDPRWLPHPIRAIGKLVEFLERGLRRVFPKTPVAERVAGCVLVVLVCSISTAVAAVILWACGLVSWWLSLAVEAVMCYQMLAVKSLRVESMKVHAALVTGSLDDARHAVAMIVGRDTDRLDAAGVTRAAVETVAESTSDGIVAPLLFMAIGGAPAGVLYKAVNTMDSMVGYRNDRYRYFGTAAARLDDVLGFVPARVGGVLMCAAAWFVHLDARGAWRVFCRDRKKHLSPNSAHTEAACAGALGVRLAGPNWYFGKLVEKPTIGDATREVEPEDIVRANRLMYATALLALLLSLTISWLVYLAT